MSFLDSIEEDPPLKPEIPTSLSCAFGKLSEAVYKAIVEWDFSNSTLEALLEQLFCKMDCGS